MELGLKNISISKSNVNSIPWSVTDKYLRKVFIDSTTIIKVCCNRIVIPTQSERIKLITENHSTALRGHKGVNKTLKRIKHGYSWLHMKKDIQNFIRKCEDCQLKKLLRVKIRQPMILTDTPGNAFDKVAMDIVGPPQPTKAGHNYILTIQDLLTKFLVAIPLEQTTATHVADAFIKKLVCILGPPRAILTDQGSNLVSSLMRKVARRFNITQYKTTVNRLQSNGSVERSHQSLIEYLTLH